MTKRILSILCLLVFPAAVFAQAPAQPAQPAQPATTPTTTQPTDVANPANPTPYEPSPGELVTEEVNEAELSPEQKEVRDRNLKAEELWKNADYRDYNREQQAQIAQDYYELLQTHGDTADYDAFIAELRAGDL